MNGDQPAAVVPNARKRRRQGIFSGLLMLLASSYVDLLLGIIRGILVRNYVGPTGRGLMRIVDLFNKWLSNAHLGSLFGLSKQLPLTLGRGDEEQAQRLEDVGATVVLTTGFVGSLLMLLYGLFAPEMGLLSRVALACGAGIVWTGQAFALYRVTLRAWGTYSVLALASVVTTLSQFVLIIGGARFYGVQGAMLGWLGANLLQLSYLHFGSKLTVRFSWDWEMIWYLIRTGLPLGAVIFADVFMRTADGLIIAHFLNLTRLGMYDIAMQVASYLYRIPESIGFVLMPRIWERYGADDNLSRLRRQILIPTLATAYTMPVMAGVVFILLPHLIHLLLPRFDEGIFPAQVLALAGVFLALPIAANGLLIALNREVLVALTKLVGGALVTMLSLHFLRAGFDLSWLARAAGVGYATASLLSLSIALSYYYPSRLRLAATLFYLHLPLLWALVTLKLSGMAVVTLLGAASGEWWAALVRLAIFLLANAPVLWYGDRRTGIISRLSEVIRARIAAARRRPASPRLGLD